MAACAADRTDCCAEQSNRSAPGRTVTWKTGLTRISHQDDGMIAQGFGFKEQARARHPGEICGLVMSSGYRLAALTVEPANNGVPLIDILAHQIGRQLEYSEPTLGGANVVLGFT